MKRCSSCGKTKNYEEFSRYVKKNRLSAWCKECHKIKAKEYRTHQKEETNAPMIAAFLRGEYT